ncbi:MAG TPA: endo-1,4-beta-xylanase [Phycisphaerae bacterium]|nr:endo-1,4-beta-xylanase [Phycisphaerae bacterium]HRR83644.1 endo-1,4-beta-xylanase [Phycisphaerae bacterium]
MNVLTLILAAATLAAPLPEADILGQADARIEKHRKGDIVLRLTNNGRVPPAGLHVRIRQTRHAFLFGSNIFKLGACGSPEANAAYEQHYAALLNYATLPFYWWHYEKDRGRPDYDKTKVMADWCAAHNVMTKGHPLAWNWFDPKWLPDDPKEVLRLQLERIEECSRRFAGQIDIWDVVNEATHYDRPDCKKNSPRLTKIIRDMGVGPFVRAAFQAARKGNPKATLIINDYAVGDEFAAKVIDELVDDEGRPLYDVIGIQSHQHGGAWPAEKIWDVCERFARYGKPLHFTETTFISGAQGRNLAEQRQQAGSKFKWASTPEGEKRQAEEVVRFYTILFSHPAVEAITWWDFTDYNAWQGAPAGLLREDMTPKPAYEELMKRIKGTWWTTETVATVEGNGEVRFRGFLGDYTVTTADLGGFSDRPLSGDFSIGKTNQKPIEVDLAFIP